MKPFHTAWRASAHVRPFVHSLALVAVIAFGTSACASASDEPAPITHHELVRGEDTIANASDAGSEDASADVRAPSPSPSSDWGNAGGSGSGGAAPAGSSKPSQPKRVQ
jgi:hypothetical protein